MGLPFVINFHFPKQLIGFKTSLLEALNSLETDWIFTILQNINFHLNNLWTKNPSKLL